MSQVLAAVGFILSLVAGYFLMIGLQIETTIISTEAPAGFDGVANLQLMHIQELNIVIGMGAGIAAAIFWVGAAIVAAQKDSVAAAHKSND